MGTAALDVLAANLEAIASTHGRPLRLGADEPLQVRIDGDEAMLRRSAGGWIRLHSQRSPLGEVDRWIDERLGSTPPALLVVIGLGLGYLLDALERRGWPTRVLALEPEPALLRGLLSRRDWRSWLAGGRLAILEGPDYPPPTSWPVPEATASDPPTYVHPVLARERRAAVEQARAAASRLLFGARANAEAREKNGGIYLRNTLRNSLVVAREGDAGRLEGRFADVPAIVIGAGPSLDGSLAGLREVDDRALVIAVDTALRPLLEAGIEPHLAVAVDPTEWNARHLLNLPTSRHTRLVAEASVDPAVFERFAGRAFVFRVGDHEPWPWLRSLGVERGCLRAWGSVVTCAFDLAVRLGCGPIVFAGLDLAFTGDRLYASGTSFEEDWAYDAAVRGSRHTVVKEAIERWPRVLEPSITGGQVATAAHLVAFRAWLAEQAAADPTRRFINVSGQGILRGSRIEQRTLVEALRDQPARRSGALGDRLAAAHRPDPRAHTAIVEASLRLVDDPLASTKTPMAAWRRFAGQLTPDDLTGALQAALAGMPAPAPSAYAEQFAGAALDVQQALRAVCRTGKTVYPAATADRWIATCESIVRERGPIGLGELDDADLLALGGLVAERRPGTVLEIAPTGSSTTELLAAASPPEASIHVIEAHRTIAPPLAQRPERPARAEAAAAQGPPRPGVGRATRHPDDDSLPASMVFDLVLLHDDERGTPERLSEAMSRVAPGGTLLVADRRAGMLGTDARPLVLGWLAARPDLSLEARRTDHWWSRLQVIRRAGALAPPRAIEPWPASARLADRLLQRLAPTSVLVAGAVDQDWRRVFEEHGVVRVALARDPAALANLAGATYDLCLAADIESQGIEHADAILEQVARLSDTLVLCAPPPGESAATAAAQAPIARWASGLLNRGYVLAPDLAPYPDDVPALDVLPYEPYVHVFRRVGVPTGADWHPVRALLLAKDARIEGLVIEHRRNRFERASMDPNLTQAAPDVPMRWVDHPLATADIEIDQGHCYVWRFRSAAGLHYTRSREFLHTLVYEDGLPLSKPHAMHEDLVGQGRGRTMIWPPFVHFSASDNSDPRTNGRRYTVRVPAYLHLLERLPLGTLRRLAL